MLQSKDFTIDVLQIYFCCNFFWCSCLFFVQILFYDYKFIYMYFNQSIPVFKTKIYLCDFT